MAMLLCGCTPSLAQPAEAQSARQIVGRPAPVLRFDGDEFYLVEQSSKPESRVLAFLKDGDTPENCSRRLWIRKVACRDLRAYEKAYTANWDQAQRDVTYRSDTRLIHSGWTQPGNLLQYRMMVWEQQGGALMACEFELLSRPPSHDAKSMTELVNLQRLHWAQELKGLFKQAPRLMTHSFPTK